ncbi:MAG: hypothetical protein ACJ74F_23420 [Mycobacterium sp.]|jgi:hypothetical protein|uniref:hypothetical protein n=1 Tax=Mycobacterium sp. TaxID=1785 RepID=UPI0032008790
MKRVGWAALALACLLTACVRTSDGVPVAGEAGPNAVTSLSPRSATAAPTQQGDQPAYGVVPTTRAPVPPNTVACSQSIKPSVRMTAEVDDPQAPRITVGVPDQWSMSAGTGDVGGRLDGPGGMQATITIAATQLDPSAAFRKYADDLMAESAVSSVSVLPGELCGYSGQKLMGAWSDTPQNAVEYEDRIVHIWTNSGNNYLVAVHVQAPTGTAGFDEAAALLTEDFEIVLP